MDRWLKENLVCPRDHHSVELNNDTLICPLGHTYPCVDGIPIMLLKEVKPTHEVCGRTLAEINSASPSPQVDDGNSPEETVDPYVQQSIAETCGIMYIPLINKLRRYPIPELRLPPGQGRHFLDIGCNWGRWCISAAKKGYFPVGIDPSLDAVRAAHRVARQLGLSADYIVADARFLPFRKNSFDVVFSYSVLQHFSKEDARLCLAEVKRILKVSGVCQINLPNVLGLRNLYNQWKTKGKPSRLFDVRYWNLSELVDTFTNSIGPTSLSVDGYFTLDAQISDIGLLPLRYRVVVICSETLRRMSEKLPWMKYIADSIYVTSVNCRD